MIGPNRSAGAGRDALPRVRRCTSRPFFLLLLRTRFCAIGTEALAHQLNEVFAFLGRAMSDRAGARPGARPYQSQRPRLIKSAKPRLLRRDAFYTPGVAAPIQDHSVWLTPKAEHSTNASSRPCP